MRYSHMIDSPSTYFTTVKPSLDKFGPPDADCSPAQRSRLATKLLLFPQCEGVCCAHGCVGWGAGQRKPGKQHDCAEFDDQASGGCGNFLPRDFQADEGCGRRSARAIRDSDYPCAY